MGTEGSVHLGRLFPSVSGWTGNQHRQFVQRQVSYEVSLDQQLKVVQFSRQSDRRQTLQVPLVWVAIATDLTQMPTFLTHFNIFLWIYLFNNFWFFILL